MPDREMTEIPERLLGKIVNRRRRLARLQREGFPGEMLERERVLLDRALDEFAAWAEEHAPELFYTER